MTTACSEDLASVFSPRDNKIRFTVSADESVDQTTRGMTVPHAVAFEGTQPSRPLYLSTEITQRPAATRGTRVENAAGLTSFGVSAIKTSENVTDEQFAAATPDYFYNLEATRNANEVFEIAQDYYWPSSSEKLFFYAYAPYGNNKVQISDQDAGGAQKVSFTVDTNVAVVLHMENNCEPEMEDCLEILRTVCEELEAKRIPYEFLSDGDMGSVNEGYGTRHLNYIMTKAGRSKLHGYYSFNLLMDECIQKKKNNRSYIVITPKLDDGERTALDRLQAYSDHEVCVFTGGQNI